MALSTREMKKLATLATDGRSDGFVLANFSSPD